MSIGHKHLPPRLMTPDEAVACVRSGDRVYVSSNCGNPVTLTEALARQAGRLRGVEVVHLLLCGPTPHVAPGLEDSFRHCAFFVAGNTRASVEQGRADYIPVFLSDIPRLFETGALRVDVALVSVSPPDEHGYCSLGVSVDLGLSACRNARAVVAQVNTDMPRTLGDSFLHVDEIHHFCMAEHPVVEHVAEEADETSRQIAKHVRALVSDGACIQTGFGKMPSAVLETFADLNDLGLHTELFTDAIVDLVDAGNINGRRKTLFQDKAVCTFALGTRKLFDAIDNNPFYEFRPTEQVNDPVVVAQNDDMVAINSAIEVDLTGQVVADSIGHRVYSGIGGQVDFIRGAARSRGGKPIIAMPSTAKDGTRSRIVFELQQGAGVVTSRGDVHWVATEFGAVDLHGRALRDRARMLIEIAHPSFRDELRDRLRSLGR